MSFKIIIFIFSILLIGCATKSEKELLKHYTDNITYNKSLQKSEKAQLYDTNGSTVIMLTATYLNIQKFDIKSKEDEKFIVGIYINEDVIEYFSPDDFSITLNGKKATSFKELDPKDKILKDKSLIIKWSKYYLVHFPHTNSDRFNIIFKSNDYGSGTLSFSKVARYIYSKKAF